MFSQLIGQFICKFSSLLCLLGGIHQISSHNVTLSTSTSSAGMTANVLSLKNAFNGAFNLNPDSPWITIGVMVVILLSEWFGGLTAVALTDCVQGAIMIFGALSVIGVLKSQYGGWAALSPEVRVKIYHFRE
jgi:Na+/proline symporter